MKRAQDTPTSSPETTSALLRANEQLRQELTQRDEQIKELVGKMAQAQDAERERLILEVHDGVAQTLVSAFQHLQALQNALAGELPQLAQARPLATRASALVRQAIQEAREVIDQLEPATLKGLGLAATLRQKLKELEAETGCRVKFQSDAFKLPYPTELALYRILHEAITNVKKHAHSPRLEVEVRRCPEGMKIRVQDWGVGFLPPPNPGSLRWGIGLFSMRKRAELLDGTCHITSTPNQGTTVYVEVPISE